MRRVSVRKTIGVALSVSLVCSILVSVTVVSLDKIRQENEKRTRLGNIFIDLEILREGESLKDIMERTQFLLIDLETGEEIQEERYAETFNPKDFDIKNIADNPEFTNDIRYTRRQGYCWNPEKAEIHGRVLDIP
jgi:Na+-transporting NADH:ubiquinone oxidoreductase subunit C